MRSYFKYNSWKRRLSRAIAAFDVLLHIYINFSPSFSFWCKLTSRFLLRLLSELGVEASQIDANTALKRLDEIT